MAEQNGYLVIVEQDINPNSPTYNQTREREEYNPVACPVSGADYQLIDSYCETESDDYERFTGYRIDTYQDLNPSSATYLDSYTERVEDLTNCQPQSTEPDWVETNSWCETIIFEPSMIEGNTGYRMIEYTDANEFSPTYMETEVKKWHGAGTNCPDNVSYVTFGGIFYDLSKIDCKLSTWHYEVDIKDMETEETTTISVDNTNINTILMNNYIGREYQITRSEMWCGDGAYSNYKRNYIYVDGVKYDLPATVTLENDSIIAVAESE